MRNRNAQAVALGGVLGALAVVIMNMGGLIPVATYICPMLCTILLYFVHRSCGAKFGWVWYVLVSVLSLLMGPDKEAAAVFLVIGYYPILKPLFEKSKLALVYKLLLFNAAILLMYTVMLHLFGMAELMTELTEFGIIGAVILLVLGNVTFFLLDFLLTKLNRKR